MRKGHGNAAQGSCDLPDAGPGCSGELRPATRSSHPWGKGVTGPAIPQ
jgi:hypothetical protein